MSTSTGVAVRPATEVARPIVARAVAWAEPRITDAVAEFLRADEASREALAVLHLSQSAGSALADEAERLYGEAEDAWKLVASGWAAGMFVPEDVLDAGREYVSRRPVVRNATPTTGNWRERVAAVDWSKGGAA